VVQRQRLTLFLEMSLTRFIKADYWMPRRIGPMVDGEDLLHGADKGGILLGWNAPLFF